LGGRQGSYRQHSIGARHADNEEAERNQQAGTPQSLVLHF
jgi:hypothetical protein